jgi:hypothetical protein
VIEFAGVAGRLFLPLEALPPFTPKLLLVGIFPLAAVRPGPPGIPLDRVIKKPAGIFEPVLIDVPAFLVGVPRFARDGAPVLIALTRSRS